MSVLAPRAFPGALEALSKPLFCIHRVTTLRSYELRVTAVKFNFQAENKIGARGDHPILSFCPLSLPSPFFVSLFSQVTAHIVPMADVSMALAAIMFFMPMGFQSSSWKLPDWWELVQP